MRKSTSVVSPMSWLCIVLASGILMSCTYQGLPELTPKRVFLTEWPAHPARPGRHVLLTELMEAGRSGDYPDAPYVWSGFCGERPRFNMIGLGRLYIERPSRGRESFGKGVAEPRTDPSAPLFAVIDLERPQGLADRPDIFPDYNLWHDDRDICFGTSVPSMFSVSVSNTVRIPRDVIARALRNGVQPLPDLIPFAESFLAPTRTTPSPQ